MADRWERAADRRRWLRARPSPHAGGPSPLLVVLVVLGVVVLGGLLARPGGAPDGPQGGPDGQLEVREGEAVPERTPAALADTAVIHALNTASLTSRRPPLRLDMNGWGRLVTAVSERGRLLLVLGRESGNSQIADLRVVDAATLEPVADLGLVRGPLEHLAVTGDGQAVVWLRHAREPGEVPTLHHVPLQGGPPTSVSLPEGFRVRGVGALRQGRIAVAGTVATTAPAPPLTVLVHEAGVGITTQLEIDVGEDVRDGGMRWEVARGALVWDTLRQLLHVVHPTEDRMTTVRLIDGAVLTSPAEGQVEGLATRHAALSLDGDTVVATGSVASTSGRPLPDSLPLEPLAFATDRGTLSFRAGTPAALRARGTATPGWVVAAGGGRTVLASRTLWPRGSGTELLVLDEDLQPVGAAAQLPGGVLDAQIDSRGTRLRIAMETPQRTGVAIVDLDEGRTVVERSYRAGAEAHLRAAVVIEHP